jgi:hypothetical protein
MQEDGIWQSTVKVEFGIRLMGSKIATLQAKKCFFAQRIQTQKRCLGELVDDNVCMKSKCD